MKTIKKVLGIGLIALVVFGLTLLSALYLFIGNKDISSMVSHEISDLIGGRVEIMSIEMKWFPLPHFRAMGTKITSGGFDAAFPQIDIYPRWEVMPFGHFETRRLYLKDPHIHIKSIERAGNAPVLPPLGRIIVKDGTVAFDAGSFSGLTEPMTLRGLDADISTGIHKIDIKRFVFVSDFVRSVGIKGRLLLDGPFALRLDVKGFEPHKSAFLARRLLSYLGPARSLRIDTDFTIELQGTGLDAYDARLKGDIPVYAIETDGAEINASSKAFDISFKRRQDGFSLILDRFEAAGPAFSMSGYLKKKAGNSGEEPTWDVEFKAKDVDLSGIRRIVLALLGRYQAVRDVCDIVRGGTAGRVSYAFHGKTSDLERLDAMEITADIIKAPIHIPKTDLYLDEASGPIKIVKGAISGEGLSARMGKSYASNGGLFFQISGADDSFRLDLDLDADVSALPPMLNSLVDNEGFKKELSLISGAKGRAKGHINIDGKLHDPYVHVSVSEMNGSLRYGRLPWPITIEKGRLSVAPKEVSWTDVAGDLGPHKIHAASGVINWEKDVFLKIGMFDADVDSHELYAELLRYSDIKDRILSTLSDIRGRLAIKNAVFSGPVYMPHRWKYQFHIGAQRLDIKSPDLPAQLNLIRFGLDLNEQRARITALDGMISGQPVSLTADLRHNLLTNWHGSVEMTGIAGDGVLTWIKAKKWIPSGLFPKAPCAFQRLKVDIEPDMLAVKGLIRPGVDAGKFSSSIDMDITYTKTRIAVKRLDIKGVDGISGRGPGSRTGEGCLISLDIDRRPGGAISISWQGKLSKSTLDAILEKNTLLSGTIAGTFRLGYTPGLSQPWSFEGVMDVSNLNIPWEGGPIEVQSLGLGSYGSGVNIDPIVLRFGGEEISGAGRLTGGRNGFDVKGILKSEAVSWDSLGKIIEDFLKNRGPSSLAVTGRIGFEIGKFKYTKVSPGCKGDKCRKLYTFRTVKGEAVFLKDNAIEVSIDSANLCGLNTVGKWIKHEGKGLGEGIFHVYTPLKGGAVFQETLPCLGYAGDIIEGPFDLDIRFEGLPDRWRKGHIDLTSRDGRIRRLTLLAKIFSILNVTDIFSGGLPDLFTQGFAYSKLEMSGDVEDGDLILKKMIVNGTGLNIFATGSIDINRFDSDLTFLIAPFKTIDTIITKVPVLGRVLGGKRGSLITLAVGVKGPIGDPDVTFLPAGAVGRGVLGLLTDTLKIPYYVIEPALVTSPQKSK